MAALRLPVSPTSAHFGFTVELDGVTFGLGFRWNPRGGVWLLDVADGEGGALVTGIPVVLDVPLLRRFRAKGRPLLPLGEILAYDSTGQEQDAAFDELGGRVVLYYVPAADVAALGG